MDRDRAGVWHAESVGADEVAEGRGDKEFRGARFWVKLARKSKQAEPITICCWQSYRDGPFVD